jgi:ATP-dependent DNA ligase
MLMPLPTSTLPPNEFNDPQSLFADDGYCAEEMLEGWRLLISKHGSVVRGFCRQRVGHAMPLSVVNLARCHCGDFVLDGELVGESFIAFDILDANGVNLSSEPFELRRKLLDRMSPFPMVALARGETNKTALLHHVREAGGVGIVFKRLDATYDPEQRLYGVKCQDYRPGIFRFDEVLIEKCSLGMQRGGKLTMRNSLGR